MLTRARVPALFAATLFLTSALLFGLEPLVAKGLLPVLGGGAAVWTTCVAFFQVALLAGYAYAHGAPRWLGGRGQAAAHMALLVLAAVALPLRAPDWIAPQAHQAAWLLARLAGSVGPVFVLLAATTTLTHRWLAGSGHRAARDPYFLFAASNAGSLTALVAYPLLLEPVLGLARQRWLWQAALAAAIPLVAACALAGAGGGSGASATSRPPGAISARQRLRWMALAAVPSSLLLSVTAYLTVDLAALPLLWMVPLALYLATFILAFGPRTPFAPRRVLAVQPFLLLLLAVEAFLGKAGPAWPLIPLHGVAFFVTALACHQALAARRPDPSHASDFYLCVAAGGAVGGLFNALVAPVLFTTLLEYPLGLVAAAMLRPPAAAASAGADARARRLDVVLPLALAVCLSLGALLTAGAARALGPGAGLAGLVVLLCAGGVAVYSFRRRPLRLGLGLAALAAAGLLRARAAEPPLLRARSFYAVHTVTERPPGRHTLWNGSTVHGAQDTAPGLRGEPLTYYHRTGPVGAVVSALRGRPQAGPLRAGVVGLGAGSLAAYATPGERWTFFEIDPAVISIARDPRLFTYLSDALRRGAVGVVAGDARVSLAAATDGAFDLLVLDAFSSDSIPAHLLTREALALYLRKLAPSGVMAFHISNRTLDLEPVVAAAADALGLLPLVRADGGGDPRTGKSSSLWMAVARAPTDVPALAADPRWTRPRRAPQPWTDDRSALWPIVHLRASEMFDFRAPLR